MDVPIAISLLPSNLSVEWAKRSQTVAHLITPHALGTTWWATLRF